MPDLLYGSFRYIRKERAESFRYCRVDENSVSERGIWQIGEHRRLHRSQNLAGLGANHPPIGDRTQPQVSSDPIWTPVIDRPDLHVTLQLTEGLFDGQFDELQT
jgi:hypothetical protein